MVRYKNRYFAVECEPKDGPLHAPLVLNRHAIYACVMKKVQQMHGDFGNAAVRYGLTTKYCNPYTKIAMIRVQHGAHRLVASILPLINMIDNIKVRLKVLYVGATMLKCFKFIRNHQLRRLEQFWNKMKSDDDRIKLKEAMLNLSSMVQTQRASV